MTVDTKTSSAEIDFPNKKGRWSFVFCGTKMEIEVCMLKRGVIAVAAEELDYCGINSEHTAFERVGTAPNYIEAASLKNFTAMSDWKFVCE